MWMGVLDPKDLERQLQEALKKCTLLREENERLKKLPILHFLHFLPQICFHRIPLKLIVLFLQDYLFLSQRVDRAFIHYIRSRMVRWGP